MNKEKKKFLFLELQKKIKIIEENEKRKKEWSAKSYKGVTLRSLEKGTHQYWYAQKRLPKSKEVITLYIGKMFSLQEIYNKLDVVLIKNKDYLAKKILKAKKEKEIKKEIKKEKEKEKEKEIKKWDSFWATKSYKGFNINRINKKKQCKYFFARKKGVCVYIGAKPTYINVLNKINNLLGSKNGI